MQHCNAFPPLASFDSAINSYGLNLVYNSANAICNFTGGSENEGRGLHTKGFSGLCGVGWKLSAQQTLYELNLSDFGNTTTKYIIYNDEDGTEHYFKYDSSKNKYYDEDGMNLQISKDGIVYTMQERPSEDANANNSNFAKKVFYRGYLTEIHDNNDNAIYFLYNNGSYSANGTDWKPSSTSNQKLTKIIQKNNGADEETIAILTYTNNYLSCITDRAGNNTYIYHDSSTPKHLSYIKWPDNQECHYEYSTDNGCLNSLRDDECGYGIDLTYRSFHNQQVVYVVSEFTKGSGNVKNYGNAFHAYHHSRQMMEYRFYGADHTRDTGDDIVTRYSFDYAGHTINAANFDTNKTDMLGVSTSAFTKSTGTSAKNHRMTGAAASGLTANNLVKNSGAEYLNSNQSSGAESWTKSHPDRGNALATGEYTRNGIKVSPHTGDQLFKLYTNLTNGLTQVYQNVYLEGGKEYTLSAHINTQSESAANLQTGGAFIEIRFGNTHYRSKTVNYVTSNSIDDGWERISTSFTTEPDGAGVYQIVMGLENCLNTAVAFDDLQLEAAETQSTANLLQYDSFEEVSTSGNASTSGADTYWQDSYGNNVAVSTPFHHGSYCMRIYGNYASQRRAYQDVAINQKCDNTWLLSGWAKAESIANTQADPDDADAPDDRFFGLIATIYYSDNTTENHYVPFCDDYTDWQYACGIVAPKKSNDESGNESLKITKIRVYTAYDYNCNTAYFDDVSLRAEPVETYKYDKDGKLTAVNATKNSKDSYTYNGPDLTQATQGVTGTYTYHYDSKHNMDKATTNSNNTMDVSYNSKGNAEQTKWYVTSAPGNWYLQTATEYSTNGNQTLNQTDANNIRTKNTYYPSGDQKGRLQTTCYVEPNNINSAIGNITSYSYNLDGSAKKTYQSGVIAAHYSYNKGMLSAISRKSFLRDAVTDSVINGTANEKWQSYKFAYDSFGNPTAISVSRSSDANLSSSTHDITLAQYSYESGVNNGRLAQMTYGNGDSVSYRYDRFDRVRVQENSDSTQYRYLYNSEGALERQAAITVSEDSGGNTVKTLDDVYSFEYDSLGRLIRSRQSLGGTIDGNDRICEGTTVQHTQHIYDEENRITSQTSVLGGRSYTSSYVYNNNVASNSDTVKDGSLKQVNFTAPNKTLTFSYDSLKHLQAASVSDLYQRSYSYRAITDLRSSNQISSLSYAANNSSLTALRYNYSYDQRGNITEIKENGSTIAEYTYNGQNQMVTEKRDGVTYTYTYDTAGNILNVGSDGIYAPNSYTYSDSIWQDLLTAYNGHRIYYEGQGGDAANYPVSGNPTNWYNGSTYTDLTWTQGRRLSSLSKDGTDISYTYDMNGIRSSKTVGTELHTYLTQNGQVVRETIGTGSTAKTLDFVYDNNGQPFALCYSADGGEHFYDYFYITNMQGDVVRLVDSIGTTIANYSYDAWGKLLSVTDSSGTSITSSTHIANLNPLRYRGYYYDTETGWYYLQSRYYDPEIGRFINADLPEYSATGALDDTNLFVYCGNNPTLREDKDGEFWNLVAGALIGGAISLASSYISARLSGTEFSAVDGLAAFATGALSGALAATGIGVVASTIINTSAAFGASVAVDKIKGKHIDWGKASVSALCAGVGSIIGGNGIKHIKEDYGQAFRIAKNARNIVGSFAKGSARKAAAATARALTRSAANTYFTESCKTLGKSIGAGAVSIGLSYLYDRHRRRR